MLWLFDNIRESALCNCMLHAQHCRPVACAYLAFVFRGSKGHGRHTGIESHSRQRPTAITAKAAQCFAAKAVRARGRTPGAEQKQVAERCGFAWIYIRTPPSPPLSFSLLCSYPAPPPPPDSPLNVALRCLPCLLLSSSRFPCKRTNNKKSSAFKSARSFLLHCSYSQS